MTKILKSNILIIEHIFDFVEVIFLDRLIFHVDVNSAFLSWEAVDFLSRGYKTDIRTIPCVVGGDVKKRRGIILAKSTPCKKYDIQTGESLYTALQKCPILKSVPPRFEIYKKASQALNEILKNYSDIIQKYSIDESFLDVTHLKDTYDDPITLGDEIRNRIYNELGFTVCVGISSNKLLAKMATDLRKPNFTTTLFPNEIHKMHALPIRDLFMVGKSSEKKLKNIGINTIGDLANYNLNHLNLLLKSHGTTIYNYANGIDDSLVRNYTPKEKGVGNSTTTSYDLTKSEEAYRVLLSLSESVATRLRQSKLEGNIICVGVKNSDFLTYSHQMKIDFYTNNTTQIYNYTKLLFDKVWKKDPIRHLQVRVTGLKDIGQHQITLFEYMDTKKEKNENLDKTVDLIREKYGPNSIYRCTFKNSSIKPMSGGNFEDIDFELTKTF